MAREGVGPLHIAILRVMEGGRTVSTEDIRRCVNTVASGSVLLAVLNKLEHRGWLGRNRIGWYLAPLGKRVLNPSVAAFPDSPPYKAPPPQPRRAGSDMTVYPSVYAGEEQAYREHP